MVCCNNATDVAGGTYYGRSFTLRVCRRIVFGVRAAGSLLGGREQVCRRQLMKHRGRHDSECCRTSLFNGVLLSNFDGARTECRLEESRLFESAAHVAGVEGIRSREGCPFSASWIVSFSAYGHIASASTSPGVMRHAFGVGLDLLGMAMSAISSE